MASLLLNNITLQTSEGEIFKVDEALVKASSTIKCLIDKIDIENVIPLPEISSKTLSKIIKYVKKHTEFDVAASMASMSDKKSVEAWDPEYMKVDMETLYDLMQAAYNLNIQNLYDLVCNIVVDKIKGKTPEEIRKTFNIKNDFTLEEEQDIRKMYSWASE